MLDWAGKGFEAHTIAEPYHAGNGQLGHSNVQFADHMRADASKIRGNRPQPCPRPALQTEWRSTTASTARGLPMAQTQASGCISSLHQEWGREAPCRQLFGTALATATAARRPDRGCCQWQPHPSSTPQSTKESSDVDLKEAQARLSDWPSRCSSQCPSSFTLQPMRCPTQGQCPRTLQMGCDPLHGSL